MKHLLTMSTRERFPEIEETWKNDYIPDQPTYCQVCGRKLTKYSSIRRGMGDVCASRMGVDVEEISPVDFKDNVASIYNLEKDGVVLFRAGEDRVPVTNVPHIVVDHSPDGYEFGYGGSGPADLAKNILEWYIRKYFPTEATEAKRISNYRGQCSQLADRLHQKFKREVLSEIGTEGGFIEATKIVNFINKYRDL